MATSVIAIEELTGTKRRLDLIGGGLPMKGASWGGTTVLATQWNAGNPEATQHVLVDQKDPSDWEGFWRTTMMIAAPSQWTSAEGASPEPVSTAASLYRIVEELRSSAQLLRVTWTNQQGPRQLQLVRLGRIKQFVAKPDTLDDIAWTLNFEWISSGSPNRTLTTNQDDVLAASRDAIIVQNAAVAAIEEDKIRASRQTKNAATQFNIGDLESLAGAPLAVLDSFSRAATNLSTSLQDLGKVILKVRDVPASLAGRALTTATNGVAVANQFLDAISQKGPETLAAREDAAFLAQTAAYYGKAQTQAQLMVAVNQRLSQQARQRRSGLAVGSSGGQSSQLQQNDILAAYIPKDGDTFAKIADRFYQNGDLGPELARANGISGYAIVPPRRVALVIPTRTIIDARVKAGL